MTARRRDRPHRARCNVCGDVLESRHAWEDVSCSCGRLALSGGPDLRRVHWRADPGASWTDLSEEDEPRWQVSPVGLGEGFTADLYSPPEPGAGPVFLLWHGSGARERSSLGGLAGAIAGRGRVVLVPDWDPDQGNATRSHLLTTARAAAETGAGSDYVLVGWSLGANAALDLLLSADSGLPDPVAFVGLAGGYDRLPWAGPPGWSDPHLRRPRIPLVFVHGARDEVVAITGGRAVASALRDAGLSVGWHEVDLDHAGVILARYDRELGRCVPLDESAVLSAHEALVELVVSAGSDVGTLP